MKEKVGYPWTTLPDTMFVHAGQGYAGHHTLCGTLGVSSCVNKLVLYDEKQTYSTFIVTVLVPVGLSPLGNESAMLGKRAIEATEAAINPARIDVIGIRLKARG